MKRDDLRDEAWRKAFAVALERSPLSQADLARIIKRQPQQISDWLSGRGKPPQPLTVFDIEDALGCPDALSQHLGYVRVQEPGVEAAVRQDADLSPEDRDALLRFYRVMVGR